MSSPHPQGIPPTLERTVLPADQMALTQQMHLKATVDKVAQDRMAQEFLRGRVRAEVIARVGRVDLVKALE